MIIKKILPFLLILSLCSCGNLRSVTPVIENITFTAEIEYFGEKYVCDSSITEESTKIAVSEPREISGLTFYFKSGEITADYLGITYSPDTDKSLSGNLAVIIDGIFRYIASDKQTLNCTDDNCYVKGKYNNKDFTFEFSPQGLPLNLKIEDEIKIYFKNVTIKKAGDSD